MNLVYKMYSRNENRTTNSVFLNTLVNAKEGSYGETKRTYCTKKIKQNEV